MRYTYDETMVTLPSVLKRPVPAHDAPLDARTVALRLGVALSTLNGWLAVDEERPLAERRFHFHGYRGRKRVWSEQAFRLLERAIETESEPGGCLGGWRGECGNTSVSARDKGNTAAVEAMRKVLGFGNDNVTSYGPGALVDAGNDDANAMTPEMDPCAPR